MLSLLLASRILFTRNSREGTARMFWPVLLNRGFFVIVLY